VFELSRLINDYTGTRASTIEVNNGECRLGHTFIFSDNSNSKNDINVNGTFKIIKTSQLSNTNTNTNTVKRTEMSFEPVKSPKSPTASHSPEELTIKLSKKDSELFSLDEPKKPNYYIMLPTKQKIYIISKEITGHILDRLRTNNLDRQFDVPELGMGITLTRNGKSPRAQLNYTFYLEKNNSDEIIKYEGPFNII